MNLQINKTVTADIMVYDEDLRQCHPRCPLLHFEKNSDFYMEPVAMCTLFGQKNVLKGLSTITKGIDPLFFRSKLCVMCERTGR